MKCHALGGIMLAMVAMAMPSNTAHAQAISDIAEEPRNTVAAMLHSRTDFSWLFDPVVLEHIEITDMERHDAQQVIGLANVARSKGLAERADVRAARAAADDLILAEATRRSLVDSIRPTDAEIAQRIESHPGRYDVYW